MRLNDIIEKYQVILTEGAIVERLRRDTSIKLDPHIANAGFVYSEKGKAKLNDH